MDQGFAVFPSYLRICNGEMMTASNLLGSVIQIKPVIKRGKQVGKFKELDRCVAYILLLPQQRTPTYGDFEFWTRNWVDDHQDPEWPWVHWKFRSVRWSRQKQGPRGWCSVTKDSSSSFEDGDFTGFMYVKELP